MNLILLAPLALLITTTGTGNTDPNPLPGTAKHPRQAHMFADMPTSPAPLETLWGEWVKLNGKVDCKGLSFYSSGGLDIQTEKKRLSVYCEIKERTANTISGRILAWRSGNNPPARPFTIKFLSPSKIELTLLYGKGESRKAVLQKQRDFRAGVWLID